MRFDELEMGTLEQIGSPEVNARARRLVDEHLVQHGYRLTDRLQAVVVDEQPYQVEVKIKNDQLTYVCTCPQVESGEVCAHVVALLWGWVADPGNFVNRAELKESLKKYSKKDLAEVIMELADQVPEVRTVLKQEEQGLDDVLESIDHIMEEVATESMPSAEAESKLRRAQSRADRLAQTGRLAEARSIYFYLLDNILAIEDQMGRDHLFSDELKEELFEEYCQFIHEDRNLEKELVAQELDQLASRSQVSRGELDLTEIRRQVGAG